MSDITIFLTKLRTDPENIQFSDVIALIDAHYDHIPTVFSNGTMINEATSEPRISQSIFLRQNP